MCGAVWCTVFVHVRFESPLYVTHRISEWYIVLQERSSKTVLTTQRNNYNPWMETIYLQCQTLQIHRLRYLPWTWSRSPRPNGLLLFPVAEIYFFHCGDFLVAKLGFFCCWLFSCLGRFSRRKHEKNELKNNQPRCRKNAWGEKNACLRQKKLWDKKTSLQWEKSAACNLEANMATTQLKPWQEQFLTATSQRGPWQVFDQTWPPHSFSRGRV